MSKFNLGPAKTRGGEDVEIVYIGRHFMAGELPGGALRVYRLDGSWEHAAPGRDWDIMPNAEPDWYYHLFTAHGQMYSSNAKTTFTNVQAGPCHQIRTAVIDGEPVVEVVE